MKLIIGNKNYSSWSLRGWLAAKQSGLSFEEITVPMFGKQWDALKSEDGGTQPSHGKVPILWDEEGERFHADIVGQALVGKYTLVALDLRADAT